MNFNASRTEDVPINPIFLEYLQVIIHTYLYYRKIYPSEAFELKKKYSIPVHICTHIEVSDYISKVCEAIGRILETDTFEKLEISSKINDVTVERLLIKPLHLEGIKENEISADLLFMQQEKLRCSLIVLTEKLHSLGELTATFHALLGTFKQKFPLKGSSDISKNANQASLSALSSPMQLTPSWSVALVTNKKTHMSVLQQQQLNSNLFWMGIDDCDDGVGHFTCGERVETSNDYPNNSDIGYGLETLHNEELLVKVYSKHLKVHILIDKFNDFL